MKRLINILVGLVLILAINLLCFPPGVIKAATVINVPGDKPTIQAAIAAASSGDTVQVAAGTYYENISLRDGVNVLGAGAGVTTIDGGGYSISLSVVTASNIGSGTKLDGFTITNGHGSYGGGMNNYQSSPTVSNCIFSLNSATQRGGGMYNNNSSSPIVTNCTFYKNNPGGMFNNGSSPTISNCIFSSNTAGAGGGMVNFDSSSPTVTNCIFTKNIAYGLGGAMFNSASSPSITNCTFSRNLGSDL